MDNKALQWERQRRDSMMRSGDRIDIFLDLGFLVTKAQTKESIFMNIWN